MSKRRWLFLFIGFSLTGCSLLTSERVLCPQTAIIAEFSKSLTSQEGVPFRTEMDSLSPYCTQDDGSIAIDLRLRTTSFRSLAHFHRPVKFNVSYFVVVMDKSEKVLSRSDHILEVTFEEKQTTKVTFVQLKERVPSQKEVTVYVGFNLDESQLTLLQKERNKNVQN